MTPFALNSVEIASPLWQKLQAYMLDRLVDQRARVENPRLPESDRLERCWRIDEIKKFLELGQPASK